MAFLGIFLLMGLSFLSVNQLLAQSNNPPVVLHGGAYQLIHSTQPACLTKNRFTAACSCPPSYMPSCFDALVPENTTADASDSVFDSSATSNARINSSFCICERTNGLSSAAVFGGAYQQDDPTPCTANCRYVNPHTGACSCPSGFQTTSIRSLVFGVGNAACLSSTIGSHILFCIKSTAATAVGMYATDSSTFSLNSQPVSVSVLNNFHGVYAISSNQSGLKCLRNNAVPVRTSRYLSSINSNACNCPTSACGASFFWLTDEQGSPFRNQRVVVCESSMQLVVDASTLKNKTMLGYQKWQATPKNRFSTGWRHWTKNGVDPSSNSLVDSAVFDVWPDTSEFPSANLSSAGLTRPDGSVTTLYDAYLEETSRLHFKWLQYYGLDGVWLQRFCSELSFSPLLNARTDALNQVRQYSEQYGRVFGVMWDISGTNDDNLYALLQADITRLRDQNGVFNSSAYIRNNGKPLVAVWGFGVRSEVNASTSQRCIQLLKGAGFSVMGGVSFYWRTTLGASNENFSSVYNAFDMISPWAVGVYNSGQTYLSFAPAIQNEDAIYCMQRGIGYVPVVFPGFSWTNLQNHTSGNVLNQIRRNGGVFLQTQVESLQSSVVTKQATSFSHLYIAMFDEFDEGTAIAKAAESSLDKPSQGSFLSYDADGFHVPNDHYLCLAGRHTYLLHQPLSINFPYSFIGT